MTPHLTQWDGMPPAINATPYQHQGSPPRPRPHLNPHVFSQPHTAPQAVSPPVAPLKPEAPPEHVVRTVEMRAGSMVSKVNVKDGYYSTLPPEMSLPTLKPPLSKAAQDALKEFYESMSAINDTKEAARTEGWTAGYLDKFLAQKVFGSFSIKVKVKVKIRILVWKTAF
ncbi:hypothetical protein BGW42_005763 [Actinomortierella wolfii]|nr:hypothetical protein BGW42_005763 [Actinomortierella wolfii]